VSNDVRRFEDAGCFWIFLFAGPLECLAVVIVLWEDIGWLPTLASMSALLMLIPLQVRRVKYAVRFTSFPRRISNRAQKRQWGELTRSKESRSQGRRLSDTDETTLSLGPMRFFSSLCLRHRRYSSLARIDNGTNTWLRNSRVVEWGAGTELPVHVRGQDPPRDRCAHRPPRARGERGGQRHHRLQNVRLALLSP